MLAFLALALLALAHFATARLTINMQVSQPNTNITSVALDYPTFDYFQASAGQDLYQSTGFYFLAEYDFESASPCTLQTKNLPPANLTNAGNYSSTIVAVQQADTMNAGCNNLAQVAQSVDAFNATLMTNGYAPLSLVVMHLVALSDEDKMNVRGGPSSEEYVSPLPGVPDGTPVIPMALVMPDSTADFMSNMQKYQSTQISATVAYEAGPWNDYFTTPNYYAFIYLVVCLNVCFILYAFISVIKLGIARQLKFERRNLIFFTSLFSTILFVIMLPMPLATRANITIGQFSTMIFTIAFYMLLHTWNWLFAAIYPGRWVRPQRVVICISGMFLVVCYIIETVDTLSVVPEATRVRMLTMASIGIPITQLLNAVLFCYFGVVFIVTGHKHRNNNKAFGALTQLSYIAAVGFLSIILLATGNFLVANQYDATTPSRVITQEILAYVAYTLRSIALIYIFGVRIPTKKSDSNDTLPTTSNATSRLTPIRRLARRLGLSRQDSADMSFEDTSSGSITRDQVSGRSSWGVRSLQPSKLSQPPITVSTEDSTLCDVHEVDMKSEKV